MTIRNKLISMGAMYLLSRYLKSDQVRRFAVDTTDSVLGRVGLERRDSGSTAAAMIGGLGAGMVVGAGLAMLFAPASGRELRERLIDRVNTLRDRAEEQLGGGSSSSSAGNTRTSTGASY